MKLESWEIFPRLILGRLPSEGLTYQVDLMVCCEQHLPPDVGCLGEVVHRPFSDSEEPALVTEATALALDLSRVVAERWREGKSIRISCLAGMNRSALVMACTLVRIGHTPEEAIERIRWKRGDTALCNRAFETWVRKSLRASLDREIVHLPLAKGEP